MLVGSLEVFAEKAGLSDFFVAAVIVAIVGNAAEHGGAVLVAHRGKIQLAAEIALSSAAQVAVFLIPAVALLSLLIEPLAFSFRQVEIAMLAASLLITVAVLFDGRTSRLRGGILVVAYIGVAVVFYQAGRAFLEAQSYPGGFVPRTTNPGPDRQLRGVVPRTRSPAADSHCQYAIDVRSCCR